METRKKSISLDSKKVIINIINSVGIKGLGIIVGLLTTPAYIRYFNNDAVLGVWFTLLSVLSWILNFDLGIGNGIRNKLVVTLSNGDVTASKKYISSAYLFLGSIAFVLGVIIITITQFIPWNKFFNISINDISANTLKIAVVIIVISIILQFVLRLISSISYALQEAFIPNLLALITNIILLIYVLISNLNGSNNNIIKLASIYLIAVNIPLIIVTLFMFYGKIKDLRPNIKYFDIAYALDILKVGSAFLGLQLEAMIINNTSVFLITFLLGSSLVVEYNIYFKIFSLATTMYSLITVPIWSAVTKAKEEKNFLWIKKILRVLQGIAILFMIVLIISLPIMQSIFNIWLKENSFNVNYIIMVLFAVEQFIMIWSGINASICSGLNEVKLQFKLMTIGAIIVIPIAILMTKITNSYIGVILGHIIALFPYCIGQSVWLEKYIKYKINQN